MNKEKIFEAVKIAYNTLDDKMAVDIKVVDTANLTPLADYFIVASANNSSQLRAMSEAVEEELHKKCSIEKKHVEGMQTKSWVLLDFGDIIVHLFNSEDREYYDIEKLWENGEEIEESLLKK